MGEERQEAGCKQKEEEALCRLEEIRQLDQEHLERMARIKETREWEEKARWDSEVELVQHTLEAEVARAEESPPQDENNEALDYYDNIDQDTEMASSQETVPMTSQESKDTTPASSQESMSQETPMPSLESAADPTILNATSRTSMEDETCLEGPTMKCTPEERALLNPLLARFLDHLEDVPLGYLNVLAARIDEIRKVKVSQMPVPLPRVLPRLLPPLPISRPPQPVLTLSESSPTASLS